jgi:hypothetical protein
MLTEMADETSAAPAALAYLQELQPDLRAAALFDEAGETLASLGPGEAWQGPGKVLLERLDAIAGNRAKEAHLATAGGEVFLVAGRQLRLLAVADRFVLASLLSFDMRTVLRQIEGV